MGQAHVIGREYKIMLRASCYAGNEDALRQHARVFWQEYIRAIGAVVFDTDGTLDEIASRRRIRFYDTPDHWLHRHGYICRERQGAGAEGREVMLKYRHPDRYMAQDQDLDAATESHGATKFEEDIKPPFQTLYSLSTK